LQSYLAKKNLDIKNLTVAVQGFGNVGSVGARLIAQAGAKVVAIGDVSVNIYIRIISSRAVSAFQDNLSLDIFHVVFV